MVSYNKGSYNTCRSAKNFVENKREDTRRALPTGRAQTRQAVKAFKLLMNDKTEELQRQ